jgi:hypothetical protein
MSNFFHTISHFLPDNFPHFSGKITAAQLASLKPSWMRQDR